MTSMTVTMDAPLGITALDRAVQDIIGKPLDRLEGALKVTGRARYAAEYGAEAAVAHGFMVTATIAKGKVLACHTETARAMPGVIGICGFAKAADQLVTEVSHFGEPLALVVAESFEQARAAALAITIDYAPEAGQFTLADQRDASRVPHDGMFVPENDKGDFDYAFAAAPVTLDITYTTPSQMHCAMEPHASLAIWDGDALTLYSSYQMLAQAAGEVAKGLGIARRHVRIVAPYVGGGFGSKLGIGPDALLAANAARIFQRPVKLVLTRRQLFHATSRRSETIQRLRLGADRDGRLLAIGHDTLCGNLPGESFFEPAGLMTTSLYAGPHRRIRHRLAAIDLPHAGAMRAPGEAVGQLALECAMDELADKLGLDPIALRRLNEPAEDPQDGLPFSSRNLIACLDEGARRFGWARRNARPAAQRDGEWLIGMGVAAAARKNLLQPSTATVRLRADGIAEVETDLTDIGTGSYSILAQIAGELLGLPVDRVKVALGDTRWPASAGSGGSWGATSGGGSVHIACEQITAALAKKVGVDPAALTLKDGHAVAGNRSTPIVELLAGKAIEASGTIRPGRSNRAYHQASYGAHFAEVAVSRVTGETRVRRMLGVFAAGRILNAKTARSQCIGGMIFGIGAALTEQLDIDDRYGRFVNADLAEYHLPVNADVPQIAVHFIEERDEVANPLKAKGVGELGISGAGAAVANAIYNATGVRLRDYPMTLDKVIAGLPDPSF